MIRLLRNNLDFPNVEIDIQKNSDRIPVASLTNPCYVKGTYGSKGRLSREDELTLEEINDLLKDETKDLYLRNIY